VLWLVQALEANEPNRPNIIFVLADDLGWSELGCYGNGFNETPHLDRMAKDGMRFTQAYAAAPVCSPYRAALLTGQSPARVGIVDYLRPNSANALSTDHVTLPEMLQRHGYRTGMIGKWHLTGYEYHGAEHEVKPRDHGFDWDFAREVKGVGNGANFWPYVFRDQTIRWVDISENRLGKQEFLVDRMNREAVDFVERNKDRPFFLYLSHYAPHSILNGKLELVAKYRKKHPPGKSTRENCYLCKDRWYTMTVEFLGDQLVAHIDQDHIAYARHPILRYKELLFATHRATRAVDDFLIDQQPEIADLPDSRRKRAMERLRMRFQNDPRYVDLVKQQEAAQAQVGAAYPQLFVTDEQIIVARQRRRDNLRDDPGFQKANNQRAAAWRDQEEYLMSHDPIVVDIQRKIHSGREAK
jgi:hypothetical protein